MLRPVEPLPLCLTPELALALTLLFPPMLKYLSVPHVDFSMALFSMLAVLAAALAVDTPSVRVARSAAVACGVFAVVFNVIGI